MHIFIFKPICVVVSYLISACRVRSGFFKMIVMTLCFLSALISNKVLAANITEGSANVYPCPGFPTSYFSLGNIVVTEADNADFSNGTNVTFILDVPANFEFQPGVGSVSRSGPNLSAASIAVTATQITVTMTVAGATGGGFNPDILTISGIKVRGITAMTASSPIKRSGGTAVIVGAVANGLTYGNIASITFPSANAGTDQIICATNSTFAADLLFDPNITGVWTLVSGTGTIATPGSPISTVTGLTLGDNIFKWSISSGGCTSSANVTITAMASGLGCTVAINYFAPVTAINNTYAAQNIVCPPPSTAPGITQFTLGGPDVAKFNVGDKVLVIQMQGAIVNTAAAAIDIGGQDGVFGTVTDYNGAGNYEYAIIATKVGSVVTFSQNLLNRYDVAGKVQLVTVPQFANYTLSSTLTGTPWNKAAGTGGVFVMEVFGTLTMNGGSINMDYRGFLGGGSTIYPGAPMTGAALNTGVYCTGGCGPGTARCGFGVYSTGVATPSTGYRGDGIATSSSHIFGRGALANGGGSGGGWNSGAGGGANVCAGGRGGYEFSSCYNTSAVTKPYFTGGVPNYDVGGLGSLAGNVPARMHGIGGYALDASGPRVFMGGGGGAANGDGNAATAGGNGGGIIIITAGTIAGTTGTLTANGQKGYSNSVAPYSSTVDATGAGGAGGSIVLDVETYSIGTLNLTVNGGKGGNQDQPNTCHGNGGGGGAGLVRHKGIGPNVLITAVGGNIGVQRPSPTNDPNTDSSLPFSNDNACAGGTTYGAMPGGSCGGSTTNELKPVPQKGCCSPADLGDDKTICGAASVLLSNGTASNTNKTFKWYKNGVLIGGATGPTYSATSAGAYSVVVDSTVAGFTYCSVTDAMLITNSFPTPYLGPNQQLCSPAFLDLASANEGSFPASTTWTWTKDGTVIAGETTPYLYNVTAAGTYTLTASSPSAGCGPTSASITLTTVLPVVVDGCRSSAGVVNLSVSGGNGGPYQWWDAETGGTLKTTGTTYSPNVASTTTFWVQDNGLYQTTIGPPLTMGTGGSIGGTGNISPMNVQFDLTQSINLLGMTLQYWANTCGGNVSYTINITNASTGFNQTRSGTAGACGPGIQVYNVTFGTPIVIPAGTGYVINSTGSSHTIVSYNGTFPYPSTYNSFLKMMSTTNGSSDGDAYPSYFDWKVSYNKGCGRVPVIAEIGGACTLPVGLLSFKGKPNNGNIDLEWVTATEKNNDHFIISRSLDGISFLPITSIDGRGTKSTISNYAYTDGKVPAGIIYYKLTQVDIDGSATEVGFISVFNDKGFTAQVSPNPFSGKLNVNILSQKNDKVSIRVIDLTGKTVTVYDNLFANDKIEVGEELPSGLYILEVRTEYDVKTFRIVKVSE
jgi:hypothetical protein